MENQEVNIPIRNFEDLTQEEINEAEKLMREQEVFSSHPELFEDGLDEPTVTYIVNNFRTKDGVDMKPEEFVKLRVERIQNDVPVEATLKGREIDSSGNLSSKEKGGESEE